MKKLFIKLIALTLSITTLSMILVGPLQAFAESAQAIYVSDIKMSTCNSLAEAKEELKGYTVVESNINEGMPNAQQVYMGYKTTDDKDKAITDIKMMDMKGGYSFTDYNKAIDRQIAAITDEVSSFMDAIKEFQKNKKAGKYNAEYAYKKMNLFKDDDQNDKLLGDILMDENIKAEKLTTIFLEGNATMILALEEFLAIACNDNWVERLSQNVKQRYTPDAVTLDNYCEIIRDQWDFFRMGLLTYKEQIESGVGFNITEAVEETTDENGETVYIDRYSEWLETNPSDDVKYYVNTFGTAYHTLESYDYKDGTLLDYFDVPKDEIDYTYLYPIADAMTKGQLQTLQYVHLNKAVGYTSTDFEELSGILTENEENIKKRAIKTANKFIEEQENKLKYDPNTKIASIYEGVDRSLFIKDDGIALTNDALRKVSSSKDKDAMAQILNNTKWYLVAEAAVGTAAMFIGGFFLGMGYRNLAIAKGAYITEDIIELEGIESSVDTVIMESANGIPEGNTAVMTVSEQKTAIAEANTSIAAGQWTLGVSFGIMLLVIGLTLYLGYRSYMNPTYTTVPRIIVDQKTEDVFNSYGVKTGTKDYYIPYYAVKDAVKDSKNNGYADMNAWKAQQWNVMYYTTNKRAGQPILANTFKVQVGNNKKPQGYTAFSNFGLTVAADVNTHAFKEISGIFIFYKTEQSTSNTTASVFSNGYYAVTTIAGVVVGALGMLGINAFRNKKKKRETVTALND